MEKIDVLIIGAGPTGLVLALWLSRLGARVRIVDKAPEAGQTSRAVGVQARTLELYRQVGLANAVVDRGLPCTVANFWVRGKAEARLEFGDLGKALSPFPYLLIYPQDEHEKLLIERLSQVGVRVERKVEFVSFDEGAGVTARLRHEDGSIEVCEARYLAGCDGARSPVREALKLEFPGGTYARLFYVADVEAEGPSMNGELNIGMDDRDFLASFPLAAKSRARLIGDIRDDAPKEEATLDWGDINKRVIERIHLKVTRVNWFSTYRVHHRVASAFRVGHAFLLGDAAHIHSPVGGQGMNTGIGDAVNLAWKLAAVVQGKGTEDLLDSYEEERMPFARTLVKTTDRIFELATASGAIANGIRLDVLPHVLAGLSHSASVRRLLFKTISQTRIHYRHSRLSEGRAARIRGGDRLPWVSYGDHDNFDPLTSLGWQVHVYGEAASDLRRACEARNVPVHAFPWDAGAATAGLARGAVYLVRPDGYVAMAALPALAPSSFERYFGGHGIRPN